MATGIALNHPPVVSDPAKPVVPVAPGSSKQRGDWARFPAAVILWIIAAGFLAATTWAEWRIFHVIAWMWNVLTWKGDGAPPGPVTLVYFFFPLTVIVAAVIAISSIGGVMALTLAGRRLMRRDSHPSFVLHLALALMLLPFGYAVVSNVFFQNGQFGIPSTRHWIAFVNRDGPYILAPAILVFLAITLLCCVRPKHPAPAR